MNLDQIKDRFVGTPFEQAISDLCDKVGLLEDLIYETDRPKVNKPNQTDSRKSN
jgi:hypothetical protein